MQSDGRKKCWSCDNKLAQYGKRCRGCCGRCATDRHCASCETFCEEPTLPWCRLCEKRLARSCKSCLRPDALAMEICTKCSSSSASVYKGTDYCWSCVAGGFAKNSNKRRFGADYRNCSISCYSDRFCESCGGFNAEKDVEWCSRCRVRICAWCKDCNPAGYLAASLCRACIDRSSVVQTEAILTQLKLLPRDGELLRFAMEEWVDTSHRITHMLVAANGDPARCTKHIVTVSSDRGVRVWGCGISQH